MSLFWLVGHLWVNLTLMRKAATTDMQSSGTSNRSVFRPGKIPALPGVYIFRDRFGRVIYVGKAANLRKRMSQYFQKSKMNRADLKVRSLVNSIDSWEYMTVKSENEALILESRLIKEYFPHYNVLLRDDKRFFLIKINLSEDYPRLILTRLRKNDGCRYFGPFPKNSVIRETAEFLTRYFGLRSCKPPIPTEKDHRHCLAKTIKDCCAPCIGIIDKTGYAEKVASLIKTLEGKTDELVRELRRRMQEAAASKNFEKAAGLRDMITNVEEIFDVRNRTFRFALIPASPGLDSITDLQKALGMTVNPAIIEAFDISNISGQFAVGSMVRFSNGVPDKKNYRRFRIKNINGIDDFAMMKEVISRHYGRKLSEKEILPDLIMVDGGKGQLSAALSALSMIKCPPLPVIGLAKRNEEIFLPGKSEPVVLDKNRPALKLLQAVRDEAHRFALAYHRKLREKRIQESILDEIPGIGPERKKRLLREFGSVSALKKATSQQICDRVSGIGAKFAEYLLKRLVSCQ